MKSITIYLIITISLFVLVENIFRSNSENKLTKSERVVTDVSVKTHFMIKKLQKRLNKVEKELKNSKKCGCEHSESSNSSSDSSASNSSSSSSSAAAVSGKYPF